MWVLSADSINEDTEAESGRGVSYSDLPGFKTVDPKKEASQLPPIFFFCGVIGVCMNNANSQAV